MAKLDFPSSPTFGQQYPSPPIAGIPVYTWDMEKWVSSGPVGSPPQAPFDAMAYSGMQINGDFSVNQERDGIWTTGSNEYISDGWKFYIAGAGSLVVQAATGDLGNSHLGFSRALIAQVTSAEPSLGAESYVLITNLIEGWRTARLNWGAANAQPITLSFWTNIHRTGMYSATVRNEADDRSYPFTFTQNVSDVWEYKTITIPGDTTGTWNRTNGVGLKIQFAMAVGTAFQGPPNAWAGTTYLGATGTTNGVAATSDKLQIAGITVFPGTQAPTAAQSPNIMRPYGEELATCQRYYSRLQNIVLSGYNNTNGSIYEIYTFPIMRAVPTGAILSLGTVYNVYNIVVTGAGLNYALVTVTITAGGEGFISFDLQLDARL